MRRPKAWKKELNVKAVASNAEKTKYWQGKEKQFQ